MYNVPTILNNLNFVKIINGFSKTLQFANQIIPIYQKAKPLFTNTKNVLSVLKEISKSKILENNNQNNISVKKEGIQKESSISPTFFL